MLFICNEEWHRLLVVTVTLMATLEGTRVTSSGTAVPPKLFSCSAYDAYTMCSLQFTFAC